MKTKTKKKKRTGRRILLVLFSLVGFGLLAGVVLNTMVTWPAEGKVFTELDDVGESDWALVLGTSPRFAGQPNLFFLRRMNAASELYRAKKVKKLLLSGDKDTSRDYDEPGAMKRALLSRGVPASAMVLDGEGHRTIDSVINARQIYGIRRATIVSDDFHLPRALYMAQHEGIDAIGFSSKPVSWKSSGGIRTREIGARLLMFWDLATGSKPK